MSSCAAQLPAPVPLPHRPCRPHTFNRAHGVQPLPPPSTTAPPPRPPHQDRADSNIAVAILYRPAKLRLTWHESRSRALLACFALWDGLGQEQVRVGLRWW